MPQLKLSTTVCATLQGARNGRKGRRTQGEKLKYTNILQEAEHCWKEKIPCSVLIPVFLKRLPPLGSISGTLKEADCLSREQKYSSAILLKENISKCRFMFQLGT